MCCLRRQALQSIKKRQEFKRVYSQGKYAADSLFVVYALANGLAHSRFGITVSKKASSSAVVRNRVRRWVKESLRLRFKVDTAHTLNASVQSPIKYDLVVVARAKAAGLDRKAGAFLIIDNSIGSLFERLSRKTGFVL